MSNYDVYLCRKNDCKYVAVSESHLCLGGLFPLDDSAALRQRKAMDDYYQSAGIMRMVSLIPWYKRLWSFLTKR